MFVCRSELFGRVRSCAVPWTAIPQHVGYFAGHGLLRLWCRLSGLGSGGAALTRGVGLGGRVGCNFFFIVLLLGLSRRYFFVLWGGCNPSTSGCVTLKVAE